MSDKVTYTYSDNSAEIKKMFDDKNYRTSKIPLLCVANYFRSNVMYFMPNLFQKCQIIYSYFNWLFGDDTADRTFTWNIDANVNLLLLQVNSATQQKSAERQPYSAESGQD